MFERADAHLHLFSSGYTDLLPANCSRRDPDELTLYTALAKRAGITRGLVVGFEGMPAHARNNEYIQQVCRINPWLCPLAFISDPQRLTVERLCELKAQGFVGLSIYLTNQSIVQSINKVPKDVWETIAQHRWLISVNSPIAWWHAWVPVLDRAGSLRVIASHLGLPPAQETALSADESRSVMAPMLSLAKYPNVQVKISGLYALAKPSYAWPHHAAWPFVERALEAFGPERLLWGSDFSPSLEHVSFDQTCALLDAFPFLNDAQRRMIAGENLLTLLREVTR